MSIARRRAGFVPNNSDEPRPTSTASHTDRNCQDLDSCESQSHQVVQGVGSELDRAIANAYRDPELSDRDRALKLQYMFELAGHARRLHWTVRDV
jgi:hypothetical protein